MLLTGFLYGFYMVFILCCFVVWSKDGSRYGWPKGEPCENKFFGYRNIELGTIR
jgi:hypothetical protein